jgi:hypothetical protein
MSSQPPQVSILDARLAEIDDRLRTIQDGLTDESPAREPAARPVPRALADEVLGELRGLVEAQERLLHSVRELLRADEPAAGPDDPARLGLSVGPLRSPEQLRAFENALVDLPAVDAVALRGYEGGDRAVLDVELRPTS